jgi:hypothetical protein
MYAFIVAKRLAIYGGRDFEAPTCQTVTILVNAQKFNLPASPGLRILCVVCWCSLYKVNPLQVITNLIFYPINSYRPCNGVRIYFVLVGGAILKPPLKAVLRAGFVSSLASFGWSVARATCQCVYKIGLVILIYRLSRFNFV